MNRTTLIIALVGVLFGSALFGVASGYAAQGNIARTGAVIGCDYRSDEFPDLGESCESRARWIGVRNGAAALLLGGIAVLAISRIRPRD